MNKTTSNKKVIADLEDKLEAQIEELHKIRKEESRIECPEDLEVESGIRRVINLRLKGPGIFWHEDCADAMLMLRSYYKAGRWEMLKKMAYSGGLITS